VIFSQQVTGHLNNAIPTSRLSRGSCSIARVSASNRNIDDPSLYY
jgi:hypothetical protein